MKVLVSTKYEYCGTLGLFHVFRSIHKDEIDQEIVLVERAKMISPDGSCRYFNPIKAESDTSDLKGFDLKSKVVAAMKVLLKDNHSGSGLPIQDAVERVCLTQSMRPTHIPERSVAGDDAPVKTNRTVNRRKLVRANG